jgi:N-acetylmuramoyl-L-alanine amidase
MPITPENAVDIVMTALCCWREARGESFNAKIAQVCVVRNRLYRKWGGCASALEIVTKPWQFSAMTAPGDSNLVKWPKPSDPYWLDSLKVAEYVLVEYAPDPTGGAVFYHDVSIEGPPAAWGNVKLTEQIGKLKFYKDVK